MKAFLLLLIIIAVAMAVLMSSPDTKNIFNTYDTKTRSNSSSGSNNNSNSNNSNIQTQNSQTNTNNDRETRVAQNIAQGFSPFKDYVIIKSLRKPENFASTEYVTIGTRTTNVPINLTGWSVVSKITGKKAIIGNASPLPQQQPEQPIIVESNNDLILVSGRSLTGESFRLNICTGYFEEERNFTPSLPIECPNIYKEVAPESLNMTSVCQNYINSFSMCELAKNQIPDDISGSCGDFVKRVATYSGCVELHKNDENFYKSKWMIYLNSRISLWLKKDEVIDLFDAQGKLVDTYPH